MSDVSIGGLAQSLAEVARTLEAEGSAQETLQKMVELAVATIEGCDHAGVSIVNDEVETPAASDRVPVRVDRFQYESGEGPCLDAIREHEVFLTDDLREEQRWPDFSRRATEESGVRSMLSFRLFLEEDTLGALNLYSRRPRAFGAEARQAGELFVAHAAVALQAAREHERVEALQDDLEDSRQQTRRFAEQAALTAALQRSLLTELPDLSPLQVTARYVPASEAADVGGDWYDAFRLPSGAPVIVIGDLAGHDINAAVAMAQARSILRALAVDRQEPPGRLLCRLDAALAHLHDGQTSTCVYAQLDEHDGAWTARLASAGHLPALQITEHGARYVDTPREVLLGAGVKQARTTVAAELARGDTLLLFTDGLIERRDRDLDDMLGELQHAADQLSDCTLDELCDELLAQFATSPADDVCVIAVRVPTTG